MVVVDIVNVVVNRLINPIIDTIIGGVIIIGVHIPVSINNAIIHGPILRGVNCRLREWMCGYIRR